MLRWESIPSTGRESMHRTDQKEGALRLRDANSTGSAEDAAAAAADTRRLRFFRSFLRLLFGRRCSERRMV